MMKLQDWVIVPILASAFAYESSETPFMQGVWMLVAFAIAMVAVAKTLWENHQNRKKEH